MTILLFILLILSINHYNIPCAESLPSQIKIGILLHENEAEQELIFRSSIDIINRRGILRRTRLYPTIRKVSVGDSFDAELKACELLEDGAIAIIGPPDEQTVQHVASICDSLDIPHFNIITKRLGYSSQIMNSNGIATVAESNQIKTTSIDFSISRPILYEAYFETVIEALKWKSFVYVYEKDDSLYHMQQYLMKRNIRPNDLKMKIVKLDPSHPYRDTFWSLRAMRAKVVMLDVECPNLATVLKHAQQVSMVSESNNYLVTCLDTQTLNLDDIKYSKSLITWLSSINSHSEVLKNLVEDRYNKGIRLVPDQLKIESAQIHDAVETIVHTLVQMDLSQHIGYYPPVTCTKPQKPWQYGSTMVNYIKTSVDLDGLTGRIRFDPMGDRSTYKLDIMRLTERGPIIVGNWTRRASSSVKVDSKQANDLTLSDRSYLDSGETRDTLIVTGINSTPYFMNKLSTKPEKGNSRFEGYAVDLIDELSKIVGFDYEFKEVDDGKHGKLVEATGQWNGMIGEVMQGKADLAIGDLSITSSRELAVDFTLPFMSTGISILFKKPTTKELEFFSFLSPFENHVWFYVFGAYIGVSLLLFIVGRLSPYEWADPHPCRKEDKILRNQFSVKNSFWFTMAAVMQQGSDLAPRSLSTRLMAAIWYFFTLIMISSYTANLAAFLTVEKVVYPIEKAEDLYHHPLNIEYGCVVDGSTYNFFEKTKKPAFKKMFKEMVFVPKNQVGIDKVEQGNYAFFMESTTIEYTIERSCNLTRIGGLLDSKGYGIAIAKNSTRKRDYRTQLSFAILSLQESGMLEILKNRWWKEKRGGGACDIDDSQGGEGVKELTLENVGGVFAIVIAGIIIGFSICFLEIFTKAHHQAGNQNTRTWDQLKRRIKFALDLKENY